MRRSRCRVSSDGQSDGSENSSSFPAGPLSDDSKATERWSPRGGRLQPPAAGPLGVHARRPADSWNRYGRGRAEAVRAQPPVQDPCAPVCAAPSAARAERRAPLSAAAPRSAGRWPWRPAGCSKRASARRAARRRLSTAAAARRAPAAVPAPGCALLCVRARRPAPCTTHWHTAGPSYCSPLRPGRPAAAARRRGGAARARSPGCGCRRRRAPRTAACCVPSSPAPGGLVHLVQLLELDDQPPVFLSHLVRKV